MPRPPCAEHTYYRCCDYSFQNIICRLLRARRVAPYGGGSITACHGTPLQSQCYLKIRSANFTGEACLARITIWIQCEPHWRARRAWPYGGGSITACHGAPLQPQCYLKIRSAHFRGEARLAPKKPCGGKAIDVILLPLQGTKMWVSVPPKALPWAEFCCPLRGEKKTRRR